VRKRRKEKKKVSKEKKNHSKLFYLKKIIKIRGTKHTLVEIMRFTNGTL
jgi:hypothetical protein